MAPYRTKSRSRAFASICGALVFLILGLISVFITPAICHSRDISSQLCSILSSDISLETSFQDVSNDITHGRIGQELNEILLNVEFTSEGGKCWISYKCAGKSTVHGELETQGLSGEGQPYVSASDRFAVHKIQDNCIQVSYNDEEADCMRTFVAPVKTYKELHTQRKTIHSVDVTPGGLAVSSDSEGQLKVWETQTGAVRRLLTGHYGDVYTCQFFPSGLVILSGGADMQLKIWSAETGQCAATLIGHKAGIEDTAIVDRGRNIVSCSRDGTARLWDCGSQKCLGKFDENRGQVNCCAVRGTGGQLDLGSTDHAPDEKEVGTQDKLLVLGCESKTLQGYGLHSRKKVFELDCHDAVNVCCFLSDTCVACGTQDGHLTVLDVRNHRVPLKEWKESRNAILSLLPHDGGFFASTGDGSCFYVNESMETSHELTGSDCDPLYKTVSDGTHVYTACRDSQLRKYKLTDLNS